MKQVKEEYLDSIEEMKERFAIMIDSGISSKEARVYVLNHTSSNLRSKAIAQGLFL